MLSGIKDLVKITKGLKLLYVEDDETVRVSTLRMLDNFFNDIVVAVDGRDGIEKFNSNDIDLIITDMNMPYLSGLDMLNELNANLPALIITAHNEDKYIDDINQNIQYSYISKPLETSKFISSLIKIV